MLIPLEYQSQFKLLATIVAADRQLRIMNGEAIRSICYWKHYVDNQKRARNTTYKGQCRFTLSLMLGSI
jgi:hypothetical protein